MELKERRNLLWKSYITLLYDIANRRRGGDELQAIIDEIDMAAQNAQNGIN